MLALPFCDIWGSDYSSVVPSVVVVGVVAVFMCLSFSLLFV